VLDRNIGELQRACHVCPSHVKVRRQTDVKTDHFSIVNFVYSY
jgi:hypothetical protein